MQTVNAISSTPYLNNEFNPRSCAVFLSGVNKLSVVCKIYLFRFSPPLQSLKKNGMLYHWSFQISLSAIKAQISTLHLLHLHTIENTFSWSQLLPFNKSKNTEWCLLYRCRRCPCKMSFDLVTTSLNCTRCLQAEIRICKESQLHYNTVEGNKLLMMLLTQKR